MFELFLISIIFALIIVLYKETNKCVPIVGFKYRHKKVPKYVIFVQGTHGNTICYNRDGIEEENYMKIHDFERAFVEYVD